MAGFDPNRIMFSRQRPLQIGRFFALSLSLRLSRLKSCINLVFYKNRAVTIAKGKCCEHVGFASRVHHRRLATVHFQCALKPQSTSEQVASPCIKDEFFLKQNVNIALIKTRQHVDEINGARGVHTLRPMAHGSSLSPRWSCLVTTSFGQLAQFPGGDSL
jgi:hypothetical protein